MAKYVFARNGMGNYETGAGMREDMLMQAFNIFNHQAGVVLNGDLVVTQRAAGANMSVDVAAGRCFILNSAYSVNTANSTKYWGLLSDAVTNLSITSNTSGSTRHDLIVANIDTGASANDYATNVGDIEVVIGTPGAGQPATPSNSLLLAVLEIPTGTTTQIVDADITDSRVRAHLSLSDSIISNNSFIKVLTAAGVEQNLIGLNSSDAVVINASGGIIRTAAGDSFRFYESGNTNYGQLVHDGTNAKLSTNSGGILFDAASGVIRTGAGDTFRAYEGANTNYAELSHDGTVAQLSNSSGAVKLEPSANGQVVIIGRHPRDNSASATYQNAHIQSGWGFIDGDGASNGLDKTITLPVAYSSPSFRIKITPCGFKTSSNPTSESDFTLSTSTRAIIGTAVPLSSSQFQVSLYWTLSNFSSGTRYGFHWETIGPV